MDVEQLKLINQLRFIYSGGAVRRFHTTPTLTPNTVAEHSFGVLWMVYLLYAGSPPINILLAAAAHDLPECKFGDIPAPFKRLLQSETKESFSAAEKELFLEHDLLFTLSTEQKLVLKVADYLDGMLFCVKEKALGNKNINHVQSNFKSYLQQTVKELPHPTRRKAERLFDLVNYLFNECPETLIHG